jgi:phenylalanyl-tRNA synthetase alpha chain
MIDKINKLKKNINNHKNYNINDIEKFRIKFLGKNGIINSLFKKLKKIPPYNRKNIGHSINKIKKKIKKKIKYDKILFKKKISSYKEDLTKPGKNLELGSIHPISIIINKIIDIFYHIGFLLVEGFEIENDWYNFTSLNIPINHPSRDMQDTFFIKNNPNLMLRTHTSSIQIRYMEKNFPPIRIISSGKVYRNEPVSSRSHFMFHQIEGLYVNKGVTFSDLKQIIQYFIFNIFNKKKIRLRPSYFPFTEPSAEIDIFLGIEKEENYRITKGTGWIEIMGCGMVDPQVLKNVNIDSNIYSGFAFGIGIERISFLIYKIPDIRKFFENDIQFLKQFKKEF